MTGMGATPVIRLIYSGIHPGMSGNRPTVIQRKYLCTVRTDLSGREGDSQGYAFPGKIILPAKLVVLGEGVDLQMPLYPQRTRVVL